MHVVAPLRLSRAWECTAGTARAGKGSAGKVRECLGAVGYPPTLHGRRPRASTRAGMGEGGAVCVVRLVAVPGAQAPNIEELFNSANTVFYAIKTNKFKIKIFKKFALKDAVTAHEELEARKLTGPAILIP